MRFGENLSVYLIPEWKDCYMDYESLKIFVLIIKSIVEEIQNIEAAIAYKQNRLELSSELMTMIPESNLREENEPLQMVKTPIQKLRSKESLLRAKLQNIDNLFEKGYYLQMEIAQLFLQMKVIDLDCRFHNTVQIGKMNLVDEEQLQNFLSLIEYIYIESVYLSEMTAMNLEAERKLLKKHKKCIRGYQERSHVILSHANRKINRLKAQNLQLTEEIEDYYVERQTIEPETKDRREYLRNTARKIQVDDMDSCLLGLWVGVSLSLLAFIVAVVQINDLSFEEDVQFSRDFPTWRGLAIFIFYIWILGFDTYMFEEYKITHRLIFKFNDHHYSTSVSIFKLAGVHTSIFLILFLLYILKFTGITNFQHLPQEYIVLIGWGVFIGSLIVPLPVFNHKGRIYAFRLFFDSLLAPFRGVHFPIIWFTDQVVSLVTPLKDVAYTFCYYQDIDFSSQENPCKDSSRVEIVLIVAVVAYSYRIMQCMRQGFDKGEYFCTPFFFNTLKYSSSLITAILSFEYKLGIEGIFVFWIASAAISTIYSYCWDLKMDWNLLQSNSRHPFLRKYLSFEPARNYYIIAVSNLVMRLVWVLTLSPSIVQLLGNPNVFGLVIGMIEIVRRGIWNLLRVEKEHLENCGNFRAIPDTKGMEMEIMQKSSVDSSELPTMLMSFANKLRLDELDREFLELIREKTSMKENFVKQYNEAFMKGELKELKAFVSDIERLPEGVIQTIRNQSKANKKKSKKGKKAKEQNHVKLKSEQQRNAQSKGASDAALLRHQESLQQFNNDNGQEGGVADEIKNSDRPITSGRFLEGGSDDQGKEKGKEEKGDGNV